MEAHIEVKEVSAEWLHKRMEKLYDAYNQGLLTDDEYVREVKELIGILKLDESEANVNDTGLS